MSFLDSIVGGLTGNAAEALGKGAGDAVSDLLKEQGGVGGLIGKFSQNGLGDAVASWTGSGANRDVSAGQISQVLGAGPVAGFAEKLGLSPAQAASMLAMVVPLLIDRLTPDGDTDQADDRLKQLPGGLGGVIGGMLAGDGAAAGSKAGGLDLGGLLGGLLKR